MLIKNLPYNEKLRPWNSDRGVVFYLLWILVMAIPLLNLTGCATRPWGDSIATDQFDETALLVDSLAARDRTCGTTLEGDAVLLYRTPFDKKAVNGFLQFSLPSAYKFVITNPFGQPILVIAGNQESYQFIHTLERTYLAGSIRSFGLRKDISRSFLEGNWGDWLMARNTMTGKRVATVRRDRDNRGIWVSLEPQADQEAGWEHLLVSPDRRLYLARIIEDREHKIVAEITYDEWATAGECSQPLEINIVGLDYGSEIHIQLSDIAVTSNRQTYRLPVPPGYMRHFMP